MSQPEPAAPPPSESHASAFRMAQYGLIAFGLILLVLLFFTDKTEPLNNRMTEEGQTNAAGNPSSMPSAAQTPLQAAESTLPPQLKPLAANEAAEIQKWNDKLAAASSRADSLEIYSQLIVVARGLERDDYAAQYADAALSTSPQDTSLIARAARMYRTAASRQEDGRSAEALALSGRALKLYEQLLTLRPKDLDAQIDLSLLKVTGEQPMAGIQALVQIAKDHPNYYRPHLELGIFSIQTKQYDKARERLEQAAKAGPKAWEPFFYLAMLDEDQNLRDAARKNYQKALERNPETGIQVLIQDKLKELYDNFQLNIRTFALPERILDRTRLRYDYGNLKYRK